jgi:DivIVA domain-containing protein
MSTADVELLGPPDADDIYHPEFAVVLRGYDPEEVRSYVINVANHIEGLQRQLMDTRDQIEAARRQTAMAKEAAYQQLGQHMADLLHHADQEAERLRREGADDARRRMSEAQREAERLRRESEEAAEELRRRGEEMLWRAKTQTERVLGGLAVKRDQMLGELEGTRERLGTLVGQLDGTITITREEAERDLGAVEDVTAEAEAAMREVQESTVAPASDTRQTDELLDSMEGFDLVLPDLKIDEEGEVEEP